MKPSRLEVDDVSGDLRVTEQESSGKLPRRRKDPGKWSDDEIRASVRVAYVGRPGATSEERTAVSIVITQPERLMPRRLLRVQKRMFATGWPDYQCWVLAWDDQALTNVRMGDEPYDLVRSHGVYETEGEARADAKRWLVEQANAVAVEDISYFDLPGIARSVLLYAVRRGPGYFGL